MSSDGGLGSQMAAAMENRKTTRKVMRKGVASSAASMVFAGIVVMAVSRKWERG